MASRIYTRTGDQGETSLPALGRVAKTQERVVACGDLDELNAALGVIQSLGPAPKLVASLHNIQRSLFSIGAAIAMGTEQCPGMTADHVNELETGIDELQTQLPELDHFILPGGSEVGAQLHLARTLCRRTERSLLDAICEAQAEYEQDLAYLNRLSDWFFVAARFQNQHNGQAEERWP